MKVTVETTFSGPLKGKALRILESSFGRNVEVEITNGRCGYHNGEKYLFPVDRLWLKHKFFGQFGTRSLWEGRPDLSKLPVEQQSLRVIR